MRRWYPSRSERRGQPRFEQILAGVKAENGDFQPMKLEAPQPKKLVLVFRRVPGGALNYTPKNRPEPRKRHDAPKKRWPFGRWAQNRPVSLTGN